MRYILLTLLFLSATIAATTIGTISSVRGKVQLTHLGNTSKATIGTKLEKGDVLKTGKRAKMQVILNDKTVITIGRNSEFEVEKYFYEQGNKNSNVKLNYKKGFFKTITGKIGKVAPKKFKIKTKNSTIGIRGTQLLNMIDPVNNVETTACTQGAITVEPDTGGPVLNVNANQMVDLSAAKGAGPVKKFSAKAQAKIRSGFKGKRKAKKSSAKAKVETKTAKTEKKATKKAEKKSEKKAASKTEKKAAAKAKTTSKEQTTQKQDGKKEASAPQSKEAAKSEGASDNASTKEESSNSADNTQESSESQEKEESSSTPTGDSEQEASSEETPNEETPSEEAPAEETPTEEVAADENAVEETPSEEVSTAIDETPDTIDVDVEVEEEAPVEEVFVDTATIESETSVVEEALNNDITQVVTDEITEEIVQEVEQVIEAASNPIDTTTFEGSEPVTPDPLPEFNPF